MNKILIGCKSGWQFPKRRERCLRTWMQALPFYRDRVDAVFTFGVRELPRPERQGCCCEWAYWLEWPWDYLWCMDDDTRLSLPRLLAYDTAGADYIGPEWKPGVGYASGGGCFLSRRAVAIVAEKLTHVEGADDQLVGEVLRAAGIQLKIDNEHFKVFAELDDKPGPDNEWVYATPKVRELE
jgi:hypothetical protein